MNKKLIIGIIIALIALILITGIFLYNQNHFKVDDEYFIIPEGYSVVTDDKLPGITNGNTTIFINCTNSNNIKEKIDEYINIKETQDNTTVKITNLTIGNTQIYKANVGNSTTIIHYWFLKDNKVYKISTWSGDGSTDIVVSELIKSVTG